VPFHQALVDKGIEDATARAVERRIGERPTSRRRLCSDQTALALVVAAKPNRLP
jgi:hypothetical protein